MLTVLGTAAAGNIGEAARGCEWLCALAGGAAGAVFFAAAGLFRARCGADSFYEGLCRCFGSGAGRLLSMAAGLLFLRFGAHDLAVMGKFVSANLLEETPYLISAGALAGAAAFAVRKGERTLARWSEVMLPPVLAMFLLALCLALPEMRFTELRFFRDWRLMADGTLDFALLPFCGSLCCSVVLFRTGQGGESRRGIWGAGAAGLLLAMLYAANTALLGRSVLGNFNFPTYHALRVIGLSSLEMRLESLLMLPLVLVGFLRIAMLLLAAVRGLERAAAKSNPGRWVRWLPLPVSAGALLLSRLLYQNQSEILHAGRILRFFAAGLGLLTVLAAIIAAIRFPARKQ